MIIVDTREPSKTLRNINSNAVRALHKIPADEIVIEHALPTGDILVSLANCALPTNLAQYVEWSTKIGHGSDRIEQAIANPTQTAISVLSEHGVLIERKAPNDFLSSLGDGRLFDQAARLVAATKFPVIALTGNLYEENNIVITEKRDTKWNWWSVQMAIVRLQMAGCTFLQTSEEKLPELACYLWRWLQEGNKPVRRPCHAPLIPLSEEAEFLCGIPGIGPEKANEILNYTGSLTSALHFLTNRESARLPNRPFGFGVKTINAVRRFFKLGEDETILATAVPMDEIPEEP